MAKIGAQITSGDQGDHLSFSLFFILIQSPKLSQLCCLLSISVLRQLVVTFLYSLWYGQDLKKVIAEACITMDVLSHRHSQWSGEQWCHRAKGGCTREFKVILYTPARSCRACVCSKFQSWQWLFAFMLRGLHRLVGCLCFFGCPSCFSAPHSEILQHFHYLPGYSLSEPAHVKRSWLVVGLQWGCGAWGLMPTWCVTKVTTTLSGMSR